MIAILGAGPHGRQIAALYPQSKLYDDHLPGCEPLAACCADTILIGAAWPKVRRQIHAKVPPSTVVHPRALYPSERGIVLFPGSQVGDDVKIGDHTHVGWNAVISHGCRVGSFVNICPGAVLAGEVTVEDDVFIGANATVIHGGITIGHGAVIGAGAVVIDNVPAGAVVGGVPARKLR